MAFTNYSIIPSDLTVVIDSVGYHPVDMNGIPADVHAIQWYGLRGEGIVEYVADSLTGLLPPQTTFTDPTVYFNQTEACENPYVVYAETDSSQYNGVTYTAGDEVQIYEYPHPVTPPAGFTTVAPVGTLPAGNTWQWDGGAFVASPFPITYNLADAQTTLTSIVKANGAVHVATQLRNHSLYEIVTATPPGDLIPADSVVNGYTTISAYQAAVDALVNPKLATIAGAALVSDLYGFDPSIAAP